jgi:hypothetical protein
MIFWGYSLWSLTSESARFNHSLYESSAAYLDQEVLKTEGLEEMILELSVQ